MRKDIAPGKVLRPRALERNTHYLHDVVMFGGDEGGRDYRTCMHALREKNDGTLGWIDR